MRVPGCAACAYVCAGAPVPVAGAAAAPVPVAVLDWNGVGGRVGGAEPPAKVLPEARLAAHASAALGTLAPWVRARVRGEGEGED